MRLPEVRSETKIQATVRVFVNGIPAGNVIFQMMVVPQSRQISSTFANQHVQPFRKVFLSYASEDRVYVLRAAQLLNVLKMKHFQDLLDLSPGDRWEQKLFSTIKDCDVFL